LSFWLPFTEKNNRRRRKSRENMLRNAWQCNGVVAVGASGGCVCTHTKGVSPLGRSKVPVWSEFWKYVLYFDCTWYWYW
jgi:hypothetical protein